MTTAAVIACVGIWIIAAQLERIGKTLNRIADNTFDYEKWKRDHRS